MFSYIHLCNLGQSSSPTRLHTTCKQWHKPSVERTLNSFKAAGYDWGTVLIVGIKARLMLTHTSTEVCADAVVIRDTVATVVPTYTNMQKVFANIAASSCQLILVRKLMKKWRMRYMMGTLMSCLSLSMYYIFQDTNHTDNL